MPEQQTTNAAAVYKAAFSVSGGRVRLSICADAAGLDCLERDIPALRLLVQREHLTEMGRLRAALGLNPEPANG